MVGALPLVVWLPKLAANGARPGLRAQPGKLSSVFNHHSVYILTVEPLTGQRHQARAEGLGFIWQASDKSTTLQCFPRSVIQVEKKKRSNTSIYDFRRREKLCQKNSYHLTVGFTGHSFHWFDLFIMQEEKSC